MPEKVADESTGAVKVKESGALNALMVPSAFLAVMTVLGGSVALTPARYPGVPGGVAAVELLAPVDAVPSGLMVAAIGAFAEGFGAPGVPSSPHPPAIIKAPNIAARLNILNNFFILPPYLIEILRRKNSTRPMLDASFVDGKRETNEN